MAGQTFYPAIPAIAQAYQNDPRTKLAAQALQDGGGTAPVAGGKWAFLSGLARAGSGVVGAIEQKQQQRKYDDKQTQVMNEVAQALGGGAAGPQQGGVGVGPAAGGTQVQPSLPPQVPPQVQNNPPPMAPPQAPPQIAAAGPQGAPPGLPPAGGPPGPQGAPAGAPIHPATPQIAAALGGGGAATPATPFPVSFPSAPAPKTSTGTQGTNVSGASLLTAMVPITAASESNGHDFKNGKPVTSPKGAQFAMQVMPATARNPGFGIAPAKDNSPAEYNRVGTELLGKLTDKYGGDPAKAWAAYNCGTGRVDHALAKNGDKWLTALPSETQKYVAKNCAALGVSPDGTAKPAAATGDEYQIPGQVPLPATDRPEIPGLPNAPADRGSVHSLALDGGRKLLNTKDPFLYEQAMEMLGKGMTEQNVADQKALDRLNGRDDTAYEAGVNNHYNAEQADRADKYATGREMRGYAHEDNTLSRTQAFQRAEGATNDAFTASQNALNRQSQHDIAQMQIDGKKDVASIRAQRLQNFLQTPQGAKMYSAANDAIQKNDNIVASIDNFMDVNKDHETGGMILNSPLGGAYRVTHPSVQQMDSLVHNLAPQLRAAGQGSMSDRDLKLFEQSIPNTGMPYETNQKRAVQFKAFVGRMNDFEVNKVQAASDGTGVNFMRDWSTYRGSVPVVDKNGNPGMSFDQWKASIPQYDAQGNKK